MYCIMSGSVSQKKSTKVDTSLPGRAVNLNNIDNLKVLYLKYCYLVTYLIMIKNNDNNKNNKYKHSITTKIDRTLRLE